MRIDKIKIETILAEKRMTRVNLSSSSGLTPQSISVILRRGTCEPKTAGKLSAGLGVSVSDIIAKEDV